MKRVKFLSAAHEVFGTITHFGNHRQEATQVGGRWRGARGAGRHGSRRRRGTYDRVSVLHDLEEAHIVVPDGGLPISSLNCDAEEAINHPKEAVKDAWEGEVRAQDFVIHGVLLLLQPLSPAVRKFRSLSQTERIERDSAETSGATNCSASGKDLFFSSAQVCTSVDCLIVS